MSAFDLRNIAIAMGKVILQLNELEKKGTGWSALDDNKEEYLVAAYMCRVGILDVIERNTSLQNDQVPVTIPLGIFKTKKTTLGGAHELTIGRLLSMTEDHNGLNMAIRDMLRRGRYFDQFEQMFPPEILKKLKN